ncbi:hypothetical protein NUW54_g7 [Trametes sanguinea]|uniref:Uncharacterized protein n=2 Tax=Trametes sanguinea TaxID=158606 RepID=A0ACC1QCQ2_9APHY|nr:hypothetical protein NUW54_g51 [Trametes sanguinea]KAJ3019687.1 hypothetical protein NUW54_g7 [Trametes sanguinea]
MWALAPPGQRSLWHGMRPLEFHDLQILLLEEAATSRPPVDVEKTGVLRTYTAPFYSSLPFSSHPCPHASLSETADHPLRLRLRRPRDTTLGAQDTINARRANECSREGTPSTGPGTSTAKRTHCSAKKLTRGKANSLVHHEPSMVVDWDLAVGPPVTGTSAKSSALPQEEDELVKYESEVKLPYSEGPSKVDEY